MSFVVYEMDWVTGEKTNPHTFQRQKEAKDHALNVVEGWSEAEDQIIFDGNMVLVLTQSGQLDFGALIDEVA